MEILFLNIIDFMINFGVLVNVMCISMDKKKIKFFIIMDFFEMN